jgi:VWFA-related protein
MKNTLSILLRLLAISTFLLGTAFSPAQQSDEPEVRITQIDTSDFPRVTLYVSFADANGAPVPVDPNRLTIYEDGGAIPLDQIEGFGDVGPLTTLLLIDVSSSMNNVDKLDSAKAAASEFVAQMRPSDQAGILAFNTNVETIQEITSDQTTLYDAIESLSARRETAMYDALLTAVDQLESSSGRKAIIVLTDGMDNASASRANDVIERIGPAGFSISTIGMGVPTDYVDEFAGIDEEALISLAEQAGGVYGYADDEESLTRLYQSYAIAMQSEYAITYTSPSTLRDGVNRSLSVSLAAAPGAAGAANEDTYNPGGLVPEVVEPVSWPIFSALIAVLVALLFLPSLVTWLAGSFSKTQKKSASGIKLSSKPRPRVKLKD